jgi:hypothetical protein
MIRKGRGRRVHCSLFRLAAAEKGKGRAPSFDEHVRCGASLHILLLPQQLKEPDRSCSSRIFFDCGLDQSLLLSADDRCAVDQFRDLAFVDAVKFLHGTAPHEDEQLIWAGLVVNSGHHSHYAVRVATGRGNNFVGPPNLENTLCAGRRSSRRIRRRGRGIIQLRSNGKKRQPPNPMKQRSLRRKSCKKQQTNEHTKNLNH